MLRNIQLRCVKKSLTTEIICIRRELREAEEKYNRVDKEIHKCFSEIPEDDQSSSELQDAKKDFKCLKLLCQAVGIDFYQIMRFVMVDNILVYRGCGKTNYFIFDFQLRVKEEPLEMCEIILNLENKELQKKLGPWIKRYSRKRDFQALMRGISTYAKLLSRMKVLLQFIKNLTDLLFEVNLSVVECVAKTKRIHNSLEVPILTIHWNIVWKDCIGEMADSFTFEIADIDIFSERDLLLWNEYTQRVSFSFEDIRRLWLSILDSVDAEN